MAVGFPASYATEIELQAGRAAARDAIMSTFELLGWDFEVQDPYTYAAKLRLTGSSWGETVTVSLANEGTFSIQSACHFQVIDWGKNRRNVNQFLQLFSIRLIRNSGPEGNREHAYVNDDGSSPVDRLLVDDAGETKDSDAESTPDSPRYISRTSSCQDDREPSPEKPCTLWSQVS